MSIGVRGSGAAGCPRVGASKGVGEMRERSVAGHCNAHAINKSKSSLRAETDSRAKQCCDILTYTLAAMTTLTDS